MLHFYSMVISAAVGRPVQYWLSGNHRRQSALKGLLYNVCSWPLADISPGGPMPRIAYTRVELPAVYFSRDSLPTSLLARADEVIE